MTNARTKKKAPTPAGSGRQWVVLPEKVGRHAPGVFPRRVTVDGDKAFVHPPEGGHTALIVPAMHVFATKDAAAVVFAGGGVLRWVVDPGSETRAAELFQARVRWNAYDKHRGGRAAMLYERADGKPIPTDAHTWWFQTFATKRAAATHFRQVARDQIREALERKEEVETLLRAWNKL